MFDFNNLFIFEMANNHQGSVEHGKRIINAVADEAEKAGVRGAVKFQFRDLDTFIHPEYRNNKEHKHISRFLSTQLSEEQFAELIKEVKKNGLITICTPFDEVSVDRILRLGIEIIKVASCSAQDWPLLQKISEANKPVICSVGGLTIKEVDKVVSFFQHRGVHFALMHCVAIYPTTSDKLHLNQIEIMKNRYPGITIGFSTHEEPSNTSAIQLAYAKGARIFEKHVGVSTNKIKLNAYSATPEQVSAWLTAWKIVVDSCGSAEERPILQKELSDLHSLKRGVYVKKPIKKGALLKRSDVFFAIPLFENQLTSGNWKDNLAADRDYAANEMVSADILPKTKSKKEIIYSTIQAVKGMLNNNRIPLSHDFTVELSHHYGLERFHETGCTIINCINREYAKKIIVQLAGQFNPIHYHKKKDETFHVLYGTVEANIDDKERILYPGDELWVPRGVWHSFGTKTGAIIEEISTTSFPDDSFYVDKHIAVLPREARKTKLYNWGRHQFDEFDEEGNIVNQYV